MFLMSKRNDFYVSKLFCRLEERNEEDRSQRIKGMGVEHQKSRWCKGIVTAVQNGIEKLGTDLKLRRVFGGKSWACIISHGGASTRADTV